MEGEEGAGWRERKGQDGGIARDRIEGEQGTGEEEERPGWRERKRQKEERE